MLHLVYFSPTHTGQTAARALAEGIGGEVVEHDLTLKPARDGFALSCGADDVLVFAFPVYAGRVPAALAPVLDALEGQQTPCIPVAVYGNRDFDDALAEAAALLEAKGFQTVGACAFIGEHSFTRKVATDRPDEADKACAVEFGRQIAERLAQGAPFERPAFKGNVPTEPAHGMPFRPVTSDACVACGACVAACPMSNISADDPTLAGDACIVCNACVKACPQGAKSFDAEPLMGIIGFLEGNCAARKEPELFI